MLWVSSALLVLAVLSGVECVRNTPRSARASRNEASLEFECPEEFGYYPHPRDCTQYYVCVFGGALLESCTGGLMYSHELQTCDWPRNVGCLGGGSIAKETEEDDPLLERAAKAESVQLEQQQQQQQQHRHQQQQQQQQSRPHQRPQIQRQQPQVTVTSSSPPVSQITERQSRQRQQHHQRTYQDDEYEPATEIESDRQQRVYRGQPSTIGQVQRDRDGLRRNIISATSRRDGHQTDFHPNPTPDPAPRRSRTHAPSTDTQPDHHRPTYQSASHAQSALDERLEDELSNDRVSVTVTSVSSSTTTTTLLQRPRDESEIDETRTPNPLHQSSAVAASQQGTSISGQEADGEVPVTVAARSTLQQPRSRGEEAVFSSPSSVAGHWQRSTEEFDKNEISVTSSSPFRQGSRGAGLRDESDEPQVSPAGTTGSRNSNLQQRSRNDDLLSSSPSWLRTTEDLERNEISVSPGPAGRGFMIKRIRPEFSDSYDDDEVPVTTAYAPQRSTTAQTTQHERGESRTLEVSVSPPSIRQRSRNGLTSSTFPPRASEKFTVAEDRQSLAAVAAARRNFLGDQENRKYYVASAQAYSSIATTETAEALPVLRILADEPVNQKTVTEDRNTIATTSTARRNSFADQENRKYYVASAQPYSSIATTETAEASPAQRIFPDEPVNQKTVTEDRNTIATTSTARRNSFADQENRKYYGASAQPYSSIATTETAEASPVQRIFADEPVNQKTVTEDRDTIATTSTARRNSFADQENRKYYVASAQPYSSIATTETAEASPVQRILADEPVNQKTVTEDRNTIATTSTARRNSFADQENRKYYVASAKPYSSIATTETTEASPAQRIFADEPVNQKTVTEDRYTSATMSTARRNSLADQENRKYYVASVQPYSLAATTEISNISADTVQRTYVDDPKIQKTVVQLDSSGDGLGEKKYYIPSVQQRSSSSYNQETSTSADPSHRLVSTNVNETPSLITENTKTTVAPSTAQDTPLREKKDGVDPVEKLSLEDKIVKNLERNGSLEDPTKNEIFVPTLSNRRRPGSPSSNEPEGNEIPSSRRPSVGVRSRQRAGVRGQSRRKPQDGIKRSSRPEREKDSVVNSRGQTESHYRAISSESPRIAKTTASTAAPVSKAYYSDADQSYPYYTIYDDDVSIYKDDDYAQYTVNHTAQIQQQQQQHQQPQHHHQHQHQNVRIAEVTPNSNQYSQKPKKVPVNDADKYNLSPEVTVSDYDIYDSQPLKNKFRISDGHQSLRTNGLSHPVLHVTTPNAIVDTYVPLTTTTQPPPTTTARPYTVTVQNRGRPQVNRGTAPPRLRPTLKPSTSIVSKAQEYVDIYRYPPVRPGPIYPTPTVDKPAAKCRKDVCLLPDCSCGGADIPGDYLPEEIPQIVILTFDDSVNDLNKGLYSDLFEKGRKNPNGCPISATFYVSHEWTDYSQVQNLYATGHEIASHTVSHSFGEQFSARKWSREVAGQREILAAYGGVKLEDVRGMRAPFLSVGGNNMFKMLWDTNFTYDSSMPIYENRPPSWPYTLDYKLFHDCMIPPCPTRSYPGLWEVPMVMWQDLNGGRCSMGDACSNPPTPDGVYKMLIKNFERHYTTNRAPFGLFYHAAWFTQPHHKEGFISFLDTIVAMDDVWVVTNWQALQWVRNPTPLGLLDTFEPFGCNYPDRPKKCNNAKVCNLWHKSGVRYMKTCQPCPDIYPWTGKTGIRSSRIDNEVEK